MGKSPALFITWEHHLHNATQSMIVEVISPGFLVSCPLFYLVNDILVDIMENVHVGCSEIWIVIFISKPWFYIFFSEPQDLPVSVAASSSLGHRASGGDCTGCGTVERHHGLILEACKGVTKIILFLRPLHVLWLGTAMLYHLRHLLSIAFSLTVLTHKINRYHVQ